VCGDKYDVWHWIWSVGSYISDWKELDLGLVLLFQLHRYYEAPIECKLRFLLDNSGRISRTKRLLTTPALAPRQCLMADFDLDMQILDTLTQLGISPSSEHIHSHQDETLRDSDEPIPWKVQIDSRCDEIATDYLQQQSQPTRKVPFLPATTVALVVEDTTITGRIPAHLRHHCGTTFKYNQRSQLQHLQKTHQWTKRQLSSVDWKTFDSATNKKASFGNQHFIL
jgi:hypothetical protein